MECAAKQAASARLLQALTRPRRNIHNSGISSIHRGSQACHKQPNSSQSNRRYASSSTRDPPPPGKPIVLEQPDKFRPPSHAAKRNARSTTGMYGAGAAYNQGMNERERARSREKSYPHMFPNPGTTMHWFLTTRWVHVSITMVGLHYIQDWGWLDCAADSEGKCYSCRYSSCCLLAPLPTPLLSNL